MTITPLDINVSCPCVSSLLWYVMSTINWWECEADFLSWQSATCNKLQLFVCWKPGYCDTGTMACRCWEFKLAGEYATKWLSTSQTRRNSCTSNAAEPFMHSSCLRTWLCEHTCPVLYILFQQKWHLFCEPISPASACQEQRSTSCS